MVDKRSRLAEVARQEALKPYHGRVLGLQSNLKPITDKFPKGPRKEFEGHWCAAFVYHCCIEAGFEIPYKYPVEGFCSFAGVRAWLEWARLKENNFYRSARHPHFVPRPGDIVIYDNVFKPGPHDHMGIVVKRSGTDLWVAEGNINNISAVVLRKTGGHIRGFVRIPDDYRFRQSRIATRT